MRGRRKRSCARRSRRGRTQYTLCPRLFYGMLLAVLLPGLSGCGKFFVPQNNTPTTNSGDYLYVGNLNGYIAGFGVSSAGKLSVLNNSPYNNGTAVLSLAVTPSNSYLYAGTASGIYAYVINSDGSLTIQNSGSPVAQDVALVSAMQVDSTGTFLLATGIGIAAQAQAIGIYQIGSSAALTALGGSPLPLYTGPSSNPTVAPPTGMLITPNNSLVYVSLGTLGVQVLTLGANGTLSTGNQPTWLPPYSKSTGPADYGLASDPNSRFLFVAELNTGLRALSIGTNGALNEISGSPYTAGTGPRSVAVDPTGSYVYAPNFGSNNISAFSLNTSSGQLTAVSGSPFASGGLLPLGLVSDNSKKYLAVINSGSNGSGGNNDLQLFSYGSAGALTAGATATTGTDPTNPQSVAATYPSAQ